MVILKLIFIVFQNSSKMYQVTISDSYKGTLQELYRMIYLELAESKVVMVFSEQIHETWLYQEYLPVTVLPQ